MRIVSFDVFRSLNIPGVRYIRPENYLEHLDVICAADWVLFPEYWQANTLHYGLNCRLFPGIASYHLGHDKVEMTRVFQAVCPENIPYTLIEAGTPDGMRAVQERLPFPFVAKDVRSSEGRGVYKIESDLEWRRYCSGREVLYAQEYLPIDRDLRLVVIGDRVVASYWRLQSPDGFHNNLAAGGRIDFSPAPPAAVELVERVSRGLGIDHAGFGRRHGGRASLHTGIQPAFRQPRTVRAEHSSRRTDLSIPAATAGGGAAAGPQRKRRYLRRVRKTALLNAEYR